MVFNSVVALAVAHVSADACQRISCIPTPDRLNSQQLLDLVCCFPLQQLGRFALCLWTFLCLPPPHSLHPYSYYHDDDDYSSSSLSSSSSDEGFDYQHPDDDHGVSVGVGVGDDDYYYHSHSD